MDGDNQFSRKAGTPAKRGVGLRIFRSLMIHMSGTRHLLGERRSSWRKTVGTSAKRALRSRGSGKVGCRSHNLFQVRAKGARCLFQQTWQNLHREVSHVGTLVIHKPAKDKRTGQPVNSMCKGTWGGRHAERCPVRIRGTKLEGILSRSAERRGAGVHVKRCRPSIRSTTVSSEPRCLTFWLCIVHQ